MSQKTESGELDYKKIANTYFYAVVRKHTNKGGYVEAALSRHSKNSVLRTVDFLQREGVNTKSFSSALYKKLKYEDQEVYQWLIRVLDEQYEHALELRARYDSAISYHHLVNLVSGLRNHGTSLKKQQYANILGVTFAIHRHSDPEIAQENMGYDLNNRDSHLSNPELVSFVADLSAGQCDKVQNLITVFSLTRVPELEAALNETGSVTLSKGAL